MHEPVNKTPCCTALLAHVDAGKTTLSEALLYVSGARNVLGRVDHQDAFLDSNWLERQRGITIFSKQALFSTQNRGFTLLDTPGHVDFGAETERVLPVLDCAVLVISGTDGVQAHTLTLWHLLERYRIPTFLFINKMDLPGPGKEALLEQLRKQLSAGCVDFGLSREEIDESAALCDEAALENYLLTGSLTDGNLGGLIRGRKVFPCCFGSALRLEGVEELLAILDRYAPEGAAAVEFGARVYKISRDPQGNRLTWVRITGGQLKVRDTMAYRDRKGQDLEEKVSYIRLYSGEKFTTQDTAVPGQCVALLGLSGTYAGQGLGADPGSGDPVLESVMTYRVVLPAGCDGRLFLPKLLQLEEEDPQLHILWDPEAGEIRVQVMGRVQMEILKSLVRERFETEIRLDSGRICYKETIRNTVEGVGHFEPLRHYAEVHLLLEPLEEGSGLVFDTACPTEVLDTPFQRLVLTHLEEKVHLGVLTGAPVTDMKITLIAGRSHLKHTEGGDFRQATYRAVRQGLMQAQSVLLEPVYDFELTVPTSQIGRAISDIRAMSGEFDPPEAEGAFSVLRGTAPVSEMNDYSVQVAAYTRGTGRLTTRLRGYAPCHNEEAVIAARGYDPEADLENTPDSVFCAHGAGFTVKWNQVSDYMHLESGLRERKQPQLIRQNFHIDEKELEAIMEREFGPVKRPQYRGPERESAAEKLVITPPRQQYLIVDGYNMIFAWEGLKELAAQDLETARRHLTDRLSNFAAFRKWELVLVFDGYKVRGNPGEKQSCNSIRVVYTKENETGDAYIEALVARIGKNYAVRVASSDALVQLSSFRSGVLRMSARELEEEVREAERQITELLEKNNR
ncbi:MAG: NYN domain-containing protein [Faecousia sp.]